MYKQAAISIECAANGWIVRPYINAYEMSKNIDIVSSSLAVDDVLVFTTMADMQTWLQEHFPKTEFRHQEDKK